jgi:hypothetical protein
MVVSFIGVLNATFKKGALDSQPQVILQVACPWSVVLSGYSGLFHH